VNIALPEAEVPRRDRGRRRSRHRRCPAEHDRCSLLSTYDAICFNSFDVFAKSTDDSLYLLLVSSTY
jgi:hypothetical protein